MISFFVRQPNNTSAVLFVLTSNLTNIWSNNVFLLQSSHQLQSLKLTTLFLNENQARTIPDKNSNKGKIPVKEFKPIFAACQG